MRPCQISRPVVRYVPAPKILRCICSLICWIFLTWQEGH